MDFRGKELMAVEEVLAALENCAPGLNGEPPLYARVDLQWDDDDRLCLTEVEMVEPLLFFRHDSRAAARLVDALLHRLSAG